MTNRHAFIDRSSRAAPGYGGPFACQSASTILASLIHSSAQRTVRSASPVMLDACLRLLASGHWHTATDPTDAARSHMSQSVLYGNDSSNPATRRYRSVRARTSLGVKKGQVLTRILVASAEGNTVVSPARPLVLSHSRWVAPESNTCFAAQTAIRAVGAASSRPTSRRRKPGSHQSSECRIATNSVSTSLISRLVLRT